MTKVKKACVILSCCAIVMLVYIYITCIYTRTPANIYQYVTPAYEEEAKSFFTENQESLTQLAEYQSKMSDDANYCYTFHAHTFDSPRIPEEIQNILYYLEERTDRQYTVLISQYEISVRIESDTYFEIYLYSGILRQHGLKPEWDKEILLDAAWELHVTYLIRS